MGDTFSYDGLGKEFVMVWREWTPMDERIRFMIEYESGVEGMTHLCRKYGISRQTGYKWLRRFKGEGFEGLRDRSRRPGSIPHKTPAAMEELLVEERRRHPSWGPKKLVVVLRKVHGITPPAPSTAGEILKRRGLIQPRPRRRASVHRWPGALKDAAGPNEVWSADFKGWFRTRDRSKCQPLTISDHYSRYLLCCESVKRPDYSSVAEVFERIFNQVGLPDRIRVDNGTPFGCPEAGQLSRLAVDWLRVGVGVEYIQPGHPEQNGRHERMHLTLKRETSDPPAESLASQQKRFEVWLDEFNHHRPHEALDQASPAEIWREPERKLDGPIPDFEYPSHWETRRAGKRGTISWQGRLIMIGRSFYPELPGRVERKDTTSDITICYNVLNQARNGIYKCSVMVKHKMVSSGQNSTDPF